MFTFVLITLVGILAIFEFSTLIVYGRVFISNKGLDLLQDELDNNYCIEHGIIHLNGTSLLKANYISTIPLSLISKYYICCDDRELDYRILRFSKAHYMIEDKFKESEAKYKHLKFK